LNGREISFISDFKILVISGVGLYLFCIVSAVRKTVLVLKKVTPGMVHFIYGMPLLVVRVMRKT